MPFLRILVPLLILPLASLAGAAEKHSLRERVAVGDQWRVEMDMRLSGQLFIKGSEKTVTLDLSASASHQFSERVLTIDNPGLPVRMARFYSDAKAAITAHNETMQRTLRPERRLQVAQWHIGETVVYSPVGPLTREEWELTGQHLDVLMIHELLPTNPVSIGDAWKVPTAAAQALAGLDGLTSHDLQCKLLSATGDQAKVAVSGPINGIHNGAEVKVKVAGHYLFDLRNKRLTALEWAQQDDRDAGPVNPAASKTKSTTTVKRSFGIPSDQLLDGVVATIPPEPGPAHLLLSHRDRKGRWEFLHDRSWHAVADTDQYAVFRLLDRGELLGQLNVTPWTKVKPGQHLDPQELKKNVTESEEFKVDQVLQAGEVPTDEGRWVYRLSVIGKTSGIQMLQNYYAIAGPKGEQVILTFTTEVPQAQKFGDRDLAIVGTVRFSETAAKQPK